MSDYNFKSDKKITDYLFVIYKWKKFLFINLFVILVGIIVYSYSLTEKFRATATIALPPEQNPMSGLGNLISGGNSALSLGSSLLGIGGGDLDVILGIFNSRTIQLQIIDKFNLLEYYEIKNNNYDMALRAFRGDIFFEPNEYGLIEVGVTHEDPIISAQITNYFIELVDSVNIMLNTTAAKNNRIYIEKRFDKNQKDLEQSEERLRDFQKKYKVITAKEQIEVTAKAFAEFEGQIIQNNILLDIMKSEQSDGSAAYAILLKQNEALKTNIRKYKSPGIQEDVELILPTKNLVDVQIEYLRLFREVEIQTKIMEFIYPLYEQAKLEEKKSVPTVLVVDKAIPPILKSYPKRAFLIIGVFSLALFFHLILIFRAHRVIELNEYRNILEQREASFYNKLVKFYCLRF